MRLRDFFRWSRTEKGRPCLPDCIFLLPIVPHHYTEGNPWFGARISWSSPRKSFWAKQYTRKSPGNVVTNTLQMLPLFLGEKRTAIGYFRIGLYQRQGSSIKCSVFPGSYKKDPKPAGGLFRNSKHTNKQQFLDQQDHRGEMKMGGCSSRLTTSKNIQELHTDIYTHCPIDPPI